MTPDWLRNDNRCFWPTTISPLDFSPYPQISPISIMPLDNYPQPTVMVQHVYEGVSEYMMRSYPIREMPLNIRPVSPLSSLTGQQGNH